MKKATKVLYGICLAFFCWVLVGLSLELLLDYSLTDHPHILKVLNKLYPFLHYTFCVEGRIDMYGANVLGIARVFMPIAAVVGFFVLRGDAAMPFRITFLLLPLSSLVCFFFAFYPPTVLLCVELAPLAALLYLAWVISIIYALIRPEKVRAGA